jgi:short-subunit dehydrogenase
MPPRVIFITGGSSGLGRATALHFARHGWHIGLIARGQPGLADAADELRRLGASVATAQADVAVAPDLAHAAASLAATLGPPHIWVNGAGNGVYGQFAAVPQDEYDRVTAVTYTGTVNGCRIAQRLMAGGSGVILNVCSAAAFHGLPLMTSYAGAKAAVRGFAQALRAELRIAGSALRVVTVFPPAVNTPFFSHAVSHAAWPARPAPPVYQPEVVAAGIYHAALHRSGEVALTGTATLFGLVNRAAPELIAWCMTRLGFDGQLSRDPAAAALAQPTLFAPSATPSPVRGPFGRNARGRSLHLAARRALSALRLARPAFPSPPTHAAPAPHPARADSEPQHPAF